MRIGELEFEEPDAPDVEPLALLHRPGDTEHAVSFARRVHDEVSGPEGRWEELFNVPAHELRGWFPSMAPWLDSGESFYSVNGMMTPRGMGQSVHEPRLQRSTRRFSRWLCAAFADLDAHKRDMTEGAVIGALWDMQRARKVPPWSMLVLSGRGVWVFWFLRASDGDAPVRASTSACAIYNQVQRTIGKRLEQLGADAGARDIERVTRVPGTVNAKARRRVQYLVAFDHNQKPYLHTLEEMAAFFGVQIPEHHQAIERMRARDPSRVLRGERGSRGRWYRELQRIEALADMRGGFAEGCRHNALRVWAGVLFTLQRSVKRADERARPLEAALRGIGEMTDRDIETRMRCEAARCVPPYPDHELRELLRETRKKAVRQWRGETLRCWLNVTPEERAELALRGLDWPDGDGAELLAEDGASRKDARERRHAAIRELILEREGKVPPLAEIRAVLLERYGLRAADRTIMNDLNKLQVTNPRGRAARGRAVHEAGPTLFHDQGIEA